MGTFRIYSHHGLTALFVLISPVDLCVSTRQVNGGEKAVLVCVGLRLVHNDGNTDSHEVTVIVMTEGIIGTIVHVVLQLAGCLICRTAERSSTNLTDLAIYIEKLNDEDITFKVQKVVDEIED